jgi:ribose 5-phosphate isomerase
MVKIRIPRETWHKVWKVLLQEGAVTRVSKDYIYLVSDRHVQLLKEKQLPFEVIDSGVSSYEKIRHLLASPIQ